MSNTPTEPASPRVLARARARGDLPYADELPLAFALITLAGIWGAVVPGLVQAFRSFATAAWSGALAAGQLWPLLRALGLLWLAPAVAALCAVVAQRAPTLRWFSEVTDRGGERRGRPARSRLTATLFTALKLLVLAVGLGAKLYDSWPGLLSAYELDAAELLAACARVGVALFWRAALLLLALGVLELGAQQLARLRRLRMTRAQVQQEQRELFGDPHMLAERRARSSGGAGGAMTMERLAPQLRAAALAQLSAASLLLTGAGRVVALRYVPAQDAVPIVWLKAEGTHAVELLQRAYHLDIPLATDNPMVAELFQHELLTPIPMACYSRVAQLLAASVGDAQATGVAS